jgi:hypothetical protein
MKYLVLSHKATSLHVRSHCPKLPQLRPTIRARHPIGAPTHVCIMYFFTLSFFCSYLSYTLLSMFAAGSKRSKDRSYLYSTSWRMAVLCRLTSNGGVCIFSHFRSFCAVAAYLPQSQLTSSVAAYLPSVAAYLPLREDIFPVLCIRR